MERNGRTLSTLTNPTHPLLQVSNLKKHFPRRAGLLRRQVSAVQAVDGVSFDMFAGETLGLVGGSGSGKTTLARTILHLVKPTAGNVRFADQELTQLGKNELRQMRRKMQIVFHDPYLSLNPRMRTQEIVAEPLQIHNLGDAYSRENRVNTLLLLVGLNPFLGNRFPYEFTGGVRTRLNIARALATEPSLLVADDIVAVLDPVVQRQIVDLLARLQQQLELMILYIAADLTTAHLICDRVAIMYLGRIVEVAETAVLYEHPLHPYTQYLLSLQPVEDPDLAAKRRKITLIGKAPHPANPPQGCHFHPRCAYATPLCRKQDTEFRNLGSSEHPHWIACHHAGQFLDAR